jgi:hypothetical protein
VQVAAHPFLGLDPAEQLHEGSEALLFVRSFASFVRSPPATPCGSRRSSRPAGRCPAPRAPSSTSGRCESPTMIHYQRYRSDGESRESLENSGTTDSLAWRGRLDVDQLSMPGAARYPVSTLLWINLPPLLLVARSCAAYRDQWGCKCAPICVRPRRVARWESTPIDSHRGCLNLWSRAG